MNERRKMMHEMIREMHHESHTTDYEMIEYSPNAEVSILFKTINEWLPRFFLALAVIFVLGFLSDTLTGICMGLAKLLLVPLKPLLTAPAVGASGAFINWLAIIVNPIFFILGSALAVVTVLQSMKPTHLRIDSYGFSFWVVGKQSARLSAGKTFNWIDVTGVTLIRPPRKRSNLDYVIAIKPRVGSEVRIRYGDIINPWDRIKFVETLKERLPAKLLTDIKQVFESPAIRQSYTEIWLRELAAPLKRDKLIPLPTGTELQNGAYTVETKLGSGGQATVYLVRNNRQFDGEGKQKLFALKEFILPVFPDPRIRMQAAERFQNEAEMLSKVKHPQIVKFMDLFIEDHRAYLVLERAEGLNLKQVVTNSGPFPEAKVIELAMQMCTILSFLHGLQPPVIHRDFTPDNLMLDGDGVLKLIDFSVAQQREQVITGSVVGKPNYISPEQFRGKPTTASDIYSLGATLFFLLTGSEPQAVQASKPAEAGTSKWLSAIVEKATAVDPAGRYQNISELESALTKAQQSPEQ